MGTVPELNRTASWGAATPVDGPGKGLRPSRTVPMAYDPSQSELQPREDYFLQ
jgi:hypothetical protein